ncbi:CRISPR-associated helicase Cas3' [Candidatus Riflebacteria bacterium]
MSEIAHIKIDNSGEWCSPHLLENHLFSVADMAREMAQPFGPDWAELAGLWHDLGKYQKAFQLYIRKKSGFEAENAHIENAPNRVTHSTAGAVFARDILGDYGDILAYIIAGHHAGLVDWESAEVGQKGLKFRLANGAKCYQDALDEKIPASILKRDKKPDPIPPPFSLNEDDLTFSLWIRMLFSCLVDADFLDTERYMEPEKFLLRGRYPSLAVLFERFQKNINNLRNSSPFSTINEIRNKVLSNCLEKAKHSPGIFSLTVPTGGGKTLSGLAFGLKHAIKWNKKRIVFAIPFTSIIEQNAAVFRSFLEEQDEIVIEHHSNLEGKNETARSRLAAENWDAPIIVTTNVQLFESLFSTKTRRCRKIHNLVNSVIILDEAQQIPRDFQEPITRLMQEMAKNYGVTWVLSTATQPELGENKDSFGRLLLKGLKNVHEIILTPEKIFKKLKRVEVDLPHLDSPRLSWEELTEKLESKEVVLAIVNTRKHARELFSLMPEDENTFHLSAQMCPIHRSHVLDIVKRKLKEFHEGNDQFSLRVISTQLVEAGVDIDFPVVFRAMAGLDSIAQSAGRCNREGKMKTPGKVIVFRPPEDAPPGILRQGQQITEELLDYDIIKEPLSPNNLARFFKLLNSKGERDKYDILPLLKPPMNGDAPLSVFFRTADKKFRLINNADIGVIVPYVSPGHEESPVIEWLNILENDAGQRWVLRKLQAYCVNLPETQVKIMVAEGAIDIKAGQYVLIESRYDQKLGILPPETMLSAENSVL